MIDWWVGEGTSLNGVTSSCVSQTNDPESVAQSCLSRAETLFEIPLS